MRGEERVLLFRPCSDGRLFGKKRKGGIPQCVCFPSVMYPKEPGCEIVARPTMAVVGREKRLRYQIPKTQTDEESVDLKGKDGVDPTGNEDQRQREKGNYKKSN